MPKPTYLSTLSDQTLVQTWLGIDAQRVKRGRSKGCVKLKAAKLGDRIIAEAKIRGLRLPTP